MLPLRRLIVCAISGGVRVLRKCGIVLEEFFLVRVGDFYRKEGRLLSCIFMRYDHVD